MKLEAKTRLLALSAQTRLAFQAVGAKAKTELARHLGFKGNALPSSEYDSAVIHTIGDLRLMFNGKIGFVVESDKEGSSIEPMLTYITSKLPGSTVERTGATYYVKNWKLQASAKLRLLSLTKKQEKLDINGDGKIDGEDLKKVREGKKPVNAAPNKAS